MTFVSVVIIPLMVEWEMIRMIRLTHCNRGAFSQMLLCGFDAFLTLYDLTSQHDEPAFDGTNFHPA